MVMIPALVIMTMTPIAIDTPNWLFFESFIFLDPFYLSLLFLEYQPQ
jgi:hypothetical protein